MPKRGSAAGRFKKPTRGYNETPGARSPAGASLKRRAGRLTVSIKDARYSNKAIVVDCTAWLELGDFGLILAKALPRILTGRTSPRSKASLVSNVSNGFIRFCAETIPKRELGLDVITQDLLNAFADSLRRTKSKKKPSSEIALSTQRHYASSARALVQELSRRGDIPEGLTIPEILGKDDAKTDPMDLAEFAKFIAACRALMLKCVDSVKQDWALAKGEVPPESEADELFKVAFRAARRKYSVLPERKFLKSKDKKLFDLVDRAGYTRVRQAMHPSAQDLTPFIYFLAAVTNYNKQTLLEISTTNIRRSAFAGQERINIMPAKPRAGGHIQPRSFPVTDEPDNPATLITFLLTWTKAARTASVAKTKNIFAFVPRDRGSKQIVRPLFDPFRRDSSEFNQHAPAFCKKLGMSAHIGTRLLRATGADLARNVFPGNPVAVEMLLGHVNWATSHPAYRSNEAKKKDESVLAGAMAARERWLRTSGAIDERAEGKTRDRRSATPGFVCLDPFSSPIPTEKHGRLCSAYGFCPTCPLTQPDPDEGYSLARMLQLRELVIRARRDVGPEAWKARFKPILDALDEIWVPAITSEATLSKAERLKLSDLPPLQ